MSNQVVIDRDARAVVYQVIDTRTSQVVKQFPEEAVLRRRAYFHTLDLTKDAPQRLSATDRRPEPYRVFGRPQEQVGELVRGFAPPLRNASRRPDRDRSVRWRRR